jgi:hypothetical protein
MTKDFSEALAAALAATLAAAGFGASEFNGQGFTKILICSG